MSQMQYTNLKQIKFNRGQVSDKLSERADMGLNNACGLVYDNAYINRYGQIEQAPVLKLSSGFVNATSRKVFMLFDTDEEWVIPVGVNYGSTSVPYYGWKHTPSITVHLKGFPYQIQQLPPLQRQDETTQTIYRNPSQDYTSEGVKYYAWNINWVCHYNSFDYAFKITQIFTTTPNPTTNDTITLQYQNYSGSSVPLQEYRITSVATPTNIYTKSETPVASADVFDAELNFIGNLHQGGSDDVIYDNTTYYRDSESDTGRGSNSTLEIYKPLSKDNNASQTDLDNPIATVGITGDLPPKVYQFGYNVVMYGQGAKPILFTITRGTNGWHNATLTVKENYFNNSFDKIYLRTGEDTAPTGFTPPTSGSYQVANQLNITTASIVQVNRNGAGSAFTADLVGQCIDCVGLSGFLQVVEFISSDAIMCRVLSPLVQTDSSTAMNIYWANGQARWVFGYEQVFNDTKGYPDSVAYAGQRLIFGGNDNTGNIICASRIGVLSDFDPETSTESDAWSATISSRNFCRIVDIVEANEELRIGCTNGEYAIPTAALSPSGVLQYGFQLRSQVGISKGTELLDVGGLTAYISHDKNSIYATTFALLQEKYTPISLSSQTDGLVKNAKQIVYLKNRINNEGNLLIGLNADGTLFGSGIDTNSGLIGLFRMSEHVYNTGTITAKMEKLFAVGYALWGIISVTDDTQPTNYRSAIVRFALQEFFDFPCAISTTGTYEGTLTIPTEIAQFVNQGTVPFRALAQTPNGFELVKPLSVTDNEDGTSTIGFGVGFDVASIIVAGFLRQTDWRSVEVAVGTATREITKNIVKLSAVVEPQEFWNGAHTETVKIPENDFWRFFDLVRGRETQKITNENATELLENKTQNTYNEGESMTWRRGFDNPKREMYFGFTAIGNFIVKSITALISYDEVP